MSDLQTAPAPRVTAGVEIEALWHGGLRRLEASGLSLLQYPATTVEAGPLNVHLRRWRPGGGPEVTALLGPSSPSRITRGDGVVRAAGRFAGLDYVVTLVCGESSTWHWLLTVTNSGTEPTRFDAVLTHDPALAPLWAVRLNEYYVSQYLDVTPVDCGASGVALGVRQNMPGAVAPWLLLGSHHRGDGWASDALQLVRRTADGVVWDGLRSPLPSRRVQHEHTLVALAQEAVELAPGERHEGGFWGILVPDHPAATGPADARWAEVAIAAQPDPPAMPGQGEPAQSSLFTGPVLVAEALGAAEAEQRAAGSPVILRDDAGQVVEWGGPGVRVVTRERDLAVLRPHGQLLRTGASLLPDTGCLTSTTWMAGSFASHLTRGHVGRGPLTTPRRSYLGLQGAHGLRMFVGTDDGWRLLELPTTWTITPDTATWRYSLSPTSSLEVATSAPSGAHELQVTAHWVGEPRPLLAALQVTDGLQPAPAVEVLGDGVRIRTSGTDWIVTAAGCGEVRADDALLHADHKARSHEFVTLLLPQAAEIRLCFTADPGPAPQTLPVGASGFWQGIVHAIELAAPAADPEVTGELGHLTDALGWFARDALVHYLSPRGLEQYTGGGWGTRDVCQGPVGLLRALDATATERDLLLRVFRTQNARGDWPQAFEFLPPMPTAEQTGAHGDVVYWPLLATGEYLLASGDGSVLDESLPLLGADGPTEPATVAEHLAQAVEHIRRTQVPGSSLPAYGHGDWNDSLQPADPQLAGRMVSTWTAVLQTQALSTLAAGLRAARGPAGLASEAAEFAARTREALVRQLADDPVLPGYLVFDPGRESPELLVHPSDQRTGLRYGVLPWIHAISADVLTREQADHHFALIERHLLGPDGARLFDAPVGYGGGPMSVFQRAEASTFWGREIGLMYVHAHLRYAEALARAGRGRDLLHALALATPGGAVALVPTARPRQQTCYASSSDGVFADRYEAQERYPALMAGHVPLEGGWRVYSSGPGLLLRLVTESLLGLRRRGDSLEIDPVLPAGSGEIHATAPVLAGPVRYLTGPLGHGVARVTQGGRELPGEPLANPYRAAGVAIRRADLTDDLLTVETL